MNLLNNVKVSHIFSSTAAATGSTGDAAAVSTAGSSGDGTTTKGGFPYFSTGLDMAGYEGVTFIATAANTTTWSLNAFYNDLSSTTASISWTAFPKAYKQGVTGSTVMDSIVLDLVNPTHRFVAVSVQLPNTSSVPLDVTAIQYGPAKRPVTSTSTGYFVSATNTVVGTTAS